MFTITTRFSVLCCNLCVMCELGAEKYCRTRRRVKKSSPEKTMMLLIFLSNACWVYSTVSGAVVGVRSRRLDSSHPCCHRSSVTTELCIFFHMNHPSPKRRHSQRLLGLQTDSQMTCYSIYPYFKMKTYDHFSHY
jgi:hypothetical protein